MPQDIASVIHNGVGMTQRGVAEGYQPASRGNSDTTMTAAAVAGSDDSEHRNAYKDEKDIGYSSEQATEAPVSPAQCRKDTASDAADASFLSPPSSSSSPPPPSSPPDGGSLAWIQVAGAFFVYANTWGLTNAFGVFQSYYQTELLRPRSASDISWIGTLQGCFLGFGALYAGPLFDYGYAGPLVWTGSALVVLGMLLTSVCYEYWQVMLAQGVVMGFGLGCLVVPSAGIVASYFSRRRSTALGVMSSGSCIGGVIYPIVFDRLVGPAGFGWATRAIGFLMIPQLLLPSLTFRQRVKPAKVRAVLDTRALKEPDFLLYGAALLVGYTGAFVPFYYIQLYCSERDIVGGDLSFYLLPIMNAVSLFGRTGFGRFADLIGPLQAYIISAVACSALLFGWIGILSQSGIVAFSVLFGVFSSGLIAVPTAVIAVTLSPTIQDYPVRFTMMLCVAGTGILIGNPIAGALLDRGWVALQAFSGACCIASAALSIAARVYRVGWALRKKI